MTNEQFWKKLDNITNKKQSMDNTRKFLKVLVEGYYQDLEILVNGIIRPNDRGAFNQACIYNEKGKKAMLYYTDFRHSENQKVNIPPFASAKLECIRASCREVINNSMEKDEVDVIIFNHGTKNMYIIPKLLLGIMMMNIGDLPK